MTLKNKKIILGVSGSIAAYKALYLLRQIIEAKAVVWPILTRSATRFVGAVSFAALSQNRPITDMWSASESGEISHVELAHRADLIVLAPATADLIARIAAGRADDPLAAVILASSAPVLIAPAMESHMWENTVTKENVRKLQMRSLNFIMPDQGHLASGAQGIGRMAEPSKIFEKIVELLTPKDFRKRHVLVSAGPTRAYIDPVRFISNASSGKMGFALASAAKQRGAEVTLVTGPTHLLPPSDVAVFPVASTSEMLTQCEAHLPRTHIFIMAAAPSDFYASPILAQKIKKADHPENWSLLLVPAPDILTSLRSACEGKIVVGFAAESDNLRQYALRKLEQKGLDMIVANDITRKDAGFAVDTNIVQIFKANGASLKFDKMTKICLAHRILDEIKTLSSE